jgi:nitrate/TMAO reductase-like tetraheme cytochrome c subunit
MMAYSWTLSTRITASGGTIQVRNGALQGYGAPVFKNYTTLQDVPVSVVANTGYKIRNVTVNGEVSTPTSPTTFNVGKIAYPDLNSQSVVVNFDKSLTPVTVTAGPGGRVSPSGTRNMSVGTKIGYTFIPLMGNRVVSISGLPASYKMSPATLPADVGENVVVNITVPATAVNMNAVFLGLVANAGAPQTVLQGSTVTLNGSATINTGTGTVSYAWAQTGGAAVALSNAFVQKPTFTAAAAGSYTFKLTATYGTYTSTSYTTVTVTNSTVAAARIKCQNCHEPYGIGVAANVFNLYSASLHAHNPYHNSFSQVTCASCHVGADTGAHPGLEVGSVALGNICLTCHMAPYSIEGVNYQKSSHYSNDQGVVVTCAMCHNPHSTVATYGAGTANGCQTCHTPGSPSGIYNADMTGKAPHFRPAGATGYQYAFISDLPNTGFTNTCSDCHGHDNTINAGWAEGGHATLSSVWNHFGNVKSTTNLKNSPQTSSCSRCHSAAGFAQFVDSGFTNVSAARALNSTYAPLVCNGCHTSPEGPLRVSGPYTAYVGYSTAAMISKKIISVEPQPSWGNSNTCFPCHTHRTSSVGLLKAQYAAQASVTTFKFYSSNPAGQHDYQIAGVVANTDGYTFTSAQGYQDRMRHMRIGVANYNGTGTSGPCVGCHMTTTAKTHNLEAVTKDAEGVNANITGITSTMCSKCHPSNFNYQDVDAKKKEFNAAVKALGTLIVKKGLGSFNAAGTSVSARAMKDPTRLGLDPTKYTAEKNAGVIYNYQLFSGNTADPAGYVHNPALARKLIYDSIDYLDDGVINDTSATTILNQGNTSTNRAFYNTTTAGKAAAYSTDPGCLGCHYGSGSNYVNGEAVPGVEQAPHYNTNGALVPDQTFTQAQFVVAGTQCNYCHGFGHGTDSPGSFGGKSVTFAYASSAHGEINGLAWTDYNFLNLSSRSACTPCHTTRGYVNAVNSANANGTGIYSTPAFIGNAGDTTKQVLGCNACHSSTAWKTSVRSVTGGYTLAAVAPSSSTTGRAAVTFPPVGESDTCVVCHSGRVTGSEITAAANAGANFSNQSFKNSHYLASAGIMYMKIGFHDFTDPSTPIGTSTYGLSYSLPITSDGRGGVDAAHGGVAGGVKSAHRALGTDTVTLAESWITNPATLNGNKGPCVTCHVNANMTGMPAVTTTAAAPFLPAGTVIPTTRAGAGHTFSGESADASKQTCMPCHNDAGEFNTVLNAGNFALAAEEKLAEAKPYFQAGLDVIKNLLRNTYAIDFDPTANPYFFEKDTDHSVSTNAVTDWTRASKTLTTLPGSIAALDNIQAAKLMGAAFNLNVLTRDPGAYVHGRSYSQRLIFDSIDYLNNLQIDRDAAATLIAIDPVHFPATQLTDGTGWLFKAGGARK